MDTYKTVEELTIGSADQSKQFRALMFTSTQDVDARVQLGLADGSKNGVTLDFHWNSETTNTPVIFPVSCSGIRGTGNASSIPSNIKVYGMK
jgi:hypothetical protein|tara:strand:- start:59 stop:334 length:276 start_codon:yes stop_codon:yes gene_type:complete